MNRPAHLIIAIVVNDVMNSPAWAQIHGLSSLENNAFSI